jgi:hypothetical protein
MGESEMKSPKNMPAILVAAALGLISVASIAAPEIDTAAGATGDAADRAAAAEPVAGGRDRRGDLAGTTEADRRSTRQQRRIAGDSSDHNVADEPRSGRARRDQGARETVATARENRTGEHRRKKHLTAGRVHYPDRGDQRNVASREGRFAGRDRYAGGYRQGAERTSVRSRGGNERFDRYDRAHAAYADRGRTGKRGFENRVDRRLSNQKSRIRDGWKSGQLSRGEFRQLRRDQKKVARMDRRFGSDGRYTKTERQRLNKALDRTSKRVRRAKNNDRVAYRSGPHERRR